jgi:hypothetical protein
MDPATRQLIEGLHRSPHQCALALTGGGTGAAALLLNVPGGSRTVLEVAVPYAEQALVEYLGCRPQQFCSEAASRDMARRAYERAGWLAPGRAVVGVGCTASLATDRPKRGDHRFHLTVHTADAVTTYTLTLTKEARTREAEEGVLDAVLLNALAEACGMAERLEPGLLPGEALQRESRATADPVTALLRGEATALCAEVDGRLAAKSPTPAVLLPGAFNPVHDGHWGLAAAATRMTGLPVAFELSVTNVDKPPLTAAEVRRRLGQFAWRAAVWLTRAPTFAEKADLFPGAVFVLGADTAVRLVAARYYQDNVDRMTAALDRIRGRGCRFLVAGRADANGTFLKLADVPMPAAHRDLFGEIPEAEFAVALSSTAIRGAQPGRALSDFASDDTPANG